MDKIVKHTSVISEPKNVYTGLDPTMHIRQIANTHIPETVDTTVLGISISCHGNIIKDKTIRNIPGVDIIKHTYAGYCAIALINPLYKRETSTLKALSLLHNFDMAYTRSQYLTSINKYADSCTDMEGSCKQFKNPPLGWIQKLYTIKDETHQLILAHANKTIDLFRCTEQELCDFIGITDSRHVATIRVALGEREHIGLTTSNLFLLIKVFQKIHNVKLVRILDESCNDAKQPLIEGFGYGGRKHKKTRRNKQLFNYLRSRKQNTK